MKVDVVSLLCDLVKTPSVNPMGRDVSGPQFYEHAMTDFLQNWFETQNLPWERQQTAPLRENILARVDGDVPPEKGGKILMFEAHQDTVPVDGMTIDPWIGEVKNGRVYGRGACDIKGGMAAMLATTARLADERPPNSPTLVMACTVNEEYGYSGAAQVARQWKDQTSRLLPRAPDAVIVAEPTLLNVVITHKGVVRWRCKTHGRAAHSSQPQLGENAFYHMARVLTALEDYAKNETARFDEHPLLGRPTLSVGLISGGISVNTVPDECEIAIDRRLLPGENPLQAQEQVIEFIRRKTSLGDRLAHDQPYIDAGGLADTNNHQLAQRLGDAARRHGGSTEERIGQPIGVPYGTDAAVFGGEGVPSVVFGPGSIDQAHTADEWLAVDQLKRASEVLYQFVREGAF